MQNFWQKLKKPFLILAPMEGVTDVVFREIVSELPKPDVFFTEFTSADGLNSKGKDIVKERLKFTKNQHPIVAQIWGTQPENIHKASTLVQEVGFDGVDLNMGCPVDVITKRGGGAAMLKNPAIAKEIITAARAGAPNLPLSVKTRIGFDTIATNEWIGFLLEQKVDALTIHGRTAIQMSKGDANWDEVGKAVQLKNKIAPETILIGNGDIKSFAQAHRMYEKYEVDGVMVGRAIFNNPWVFERSFDTKLRTKEEYISIVHKHLRLYEKTWGDTKHYDTMKKFFKMYVRDFDGSSQLRQELMETKSCSEARQVLSI